MTAATEDKTLERWESTTPGVTVWVWMYDKREDKYKKQRVGGRAGSKVLTIRRDDRIYNQEMVVEENVHLDPFTNGLLRLIDGTGEGVETKYHLTNEDLQKFLEIRDEDLFKEEIGQIDSELILRRLKDVCERHGSVWQHEFLRDTIEERYKVGGTQRAERDVYGEAKESDTGIRLS